MRDDIRKNKKPGFTLVELLIVIIIIGILAGGMMLVAGGSTDKANATKIVSDLRTLKSAALMYYSDNDKWPTKDQFSTELEPYIDRDLDEYKIDDSGKFIGYNGVLINGADAQDGVKEKLASMAKESGLYGSAVSEDAEYKNEDEVWMRLR